MQNSDVAQILQETADLIELTGGNPYRARAFSRAARSIGNLTDSAADRLSEGSLTDVSGIGDGMADHISEILQGGSFTLRDELISAVPPGLMDVMQVKGLGTKRTRRLWTELDISSLDELETAAEENRITDLDGFGAKTQQKILDNIRTLRHYAARTRLSDAWTATDDFLSDVRAVDDVVRAEVSGALRRKRETVERATVIVSTRAPSAVTSWLTDHLDEPSTESDSTVSGTLADGIPVTVHVSDPSRFGTDWWRTTGTDEHVAAVEDAHGPPGDHADEASLFEAAGLQVVPPELREGEDEVEQARRAALPSLLERNDLQGCLHNHSTYSDGANSVREMAEAARARGYSYFGICDHSQSLRIADGLSPDEVRAQHEEVQELNQAFDADEGDPFRIFHGIESDILSDGSLDYDSETLALFDFVVASVHTGFNMTEEEATDRLLRAIEDPHTRILGHPTGRLLLRREGYPVDHRRVIEACARHDVAIELNANPHRLDLDWRWVRTAVQNDVPVAINPDAHAIRELDNTRWGVAVGRKGWLTPDGCLNAKSLDAFRRWLQAGSA